ncbi:hypothetical protein OF83DRAFT_1177290, partial [Amylostereum chailletii]
SIASIVQSAVDAVTALPAGALGTGNVLSLVSGILNTILSPFSTILSLPGVDATTLQGLLAPLGIVLAALLAAVLGLVGGLLAILLPLLLLLLGPILPLLLSLGSVLAPLLTILQL